MAERVVAAHQPDLLPYTGFWHKVARADLFAVLLHDQMNQDGYTRRVKMRDKWATLQVQDRRSGQLCSEAMLLPLNGQKLWNTIAGRYEGSRFWDERHSMVSGWVDAAAQHCTLWGFNFSLLLSVRDYLGIGTPFVFPRPPRSQGGVQKLADLCDDLDATAYLSGTGARAYLTEEALSKQAWGPHLQLRWSQHVPWTGDSILTTVFDRRHPTLCVLAEGRAESPGPEKELG